MQSINSTERNTGFGSELHGASRLVVMRLVLPMGGAPRHVEFRMDQGFAERLRQLRTLVPMTTSLNRQRDLVIDKVRVRLPSAVFRRLDAEIKISGPCLVVSNEGIFHCGAKDVENGHKLLSCTFPITRLIELNAQRPAGETFFIQSGFFINDEPSETEAGRWLASLHATDALPTEGASDFDTLHGMVQRAEAAPMRATA